MIWNWKCGERAILRAERQAIRLAELGDCEFEFSNGLG